jgi:outer membrane protein OmpA-like peptidoglycan-associated protein
MVRTSTLSRICIGLFSLTLSGCFQPPYNNFQENHHDAKRFASTTAVGAGLGTTVGALAGFTFIGAAVGTTTGALWGQYKNSRKKLIRELQNQDIEYVQYGDTNTLIIPTDRYFIYNTAHFNDVCYPGLINVLKLLHYRFHSPVYVAAFTDNVGSRRHKKRLSQAQAEAMLTFLWANNVPAKRLRAEGYGDKYAIGDNHLIRGSAYNRRIEIQWFNAPIATPPPMPY